MRVPGRAHDARSSTRASWRAARSRPARSRRRWAATGCSARSPASCAAPTACSASCPAAAATTSRASSASAADPELACDVLAAGARAADRRRRGRRRGLPRHRLGGLRLRRAGHRQRDAAPARRARLRLLDAARAARLAAAPTGRSSSTASAQTFDRLLRRRRQLRRVRRRHVPRARRVARRRPARRRALPRPRPKRRYLPACRGCSRARTSTSPNLTFLRGARGRVPRRPAVRRLRRRRPDRGPARDHQGRARARCKVLGP